MIIRLLFVLLLFSCDNGNTIITEQEDIVDNDFVEKNNVDYYLDLESYLDINEDGYYEMMFLNNYVQTFTTLTAKTGSYNNYQLLYWETNRIHTIHWMGSEFETDLINHHSYTDEIGEAHTVFGPWSEFIGDTVTVYASYEDEYNNNYLDSLIIIIRGEENE